MFCIEEKNVFIYAFYIDKSRAVKCILPLLPQIQIDGSEGQILRPTPRFASQTLAFRIKWRHITRKGFDSERQIPR